MQSFKRKQITRTVYNSFRNCVTNKISKFDKHYYEIAFAQVRNDTRNTLENNCERKKHPSQSYGTVGPLKSPIKSLILVVEQFCLKKI